jgi:hypothetical protein
LNLSIRLWVQFFCFVSSRLWLGKSPLFIEDKEVLGRRIYYKGHIRKDETLRPAAFKINLKKRPKRGISLDRLSHAPINLFAELGEHNAQRHPGGSFHGFGTLTGEKIRSIQQSVKDCQFNLVDSPTLTNPFHADVRLRLDQEPDYYMLLADELAKRAKYCPWAGKVFSLSE